MQRQPTAEEVYWMWMETLNRFLLTAPVPLPKADNDE